MKRFTSFLCSLLLLSLAGTNLCAQDTKELALTFANGTCTSTDYSTTFCYSWTSTDTEPAVTISVSGNKNNLVVESSSGGFEMHEGTGSTWNFTVNDYVIVSYSFTYKTKKTGNDVTITINGAEYTSSDSEKNLEITGVNSSTTSFQLSGNNEGIIVTNLKLVVRKPLALTSLEVGQVYRFINVLYPTYSLNANSATDVNAVTTNETDTKQQWYVEKQDGEYYVLRNLAYGKYLKGNGQSSAWSMSDDYSHNYNKFKLYTSNTDYNTLHTNTLVNYAYIHCNSSHNIVGWSNGTTDKGSHWEITKVDYTAEEITALLEKAPTVAEVAAYPAALGAIFSDAACTILNSAYTTTSMTDEQLAADANYSALPQTLKNMVKKVRNDEWSEATIAPASRPNGNNNNNHNLWTVEDTWDDAYARKFRVQMYEPYSVEGEITSFLGINAHCNMDNPTGIYANAGDLIYIMVDGDIAYGAELWVAHQTGHGVTEYYNNAAYTQLKKGLNVIPYASDGCQLWINYLVHTYNTSTGEFPHKLSDYKPLKIHIEGGHINGYFNAMGDFRAEDSGTENLWGEVDNDADWDYYKARVALDSDFALLGHRQTLLFPFGTWGEEVSYVDDKGNTTTYEAGFHVANDADSVEYALAWHLEHIEVPTTPNCYAGSGNAFGDFSDTYYPGMNLITNGTLNKINIMLEAWDRIMYSEHATMGLLSKSNIDKMNSLYPGWTVQNTTFDIYNYGSNDTGETYKAFCEGRDYSDYYNHHGAAVGSGTGYMSGGPRVCSYHYNTMGSIIGKIAVEAGPTWGPAHEIGHQHQAIFNLNGQTEVTNNFFSNVAVWYMGMGTSRVNGTEGSLASVLDAFNTEDNDLYTNNIWAITHLYYRLWLYYHLAGNNTQFWPRLFELLRQTPMVNGGQISGETSLLRFYQHACTAAGEDLTEFFRAHGFFELMTNRFVGDYSNATYNITEEQIETAITAVKENNYPVNYAVLLINDATSETTLKHDGTTKRALWDTKASAEYGSVNDFIEGNTSVTEAYTAIVGSDGTVTMSGGEGGVGFLVFNEDGELVSFSNKSTFELSDEAKETIMSGNATFVAVDSESNTTTAEVYLTAMQRTILAELIAMAQQIKDKIDDSYTKIGFYKAAAVADLAAALENAKKVYDAGTSGYGAAYDLLYAEYQKVLENPDARIPFDPSLTYIITNKAYTNQTMWVNDALTVRSDGGVDQTADAAKWQFKATASDGVYNIYNKKGYYCPAVVQSTAMTATETPNADALYTLQEMEAGVWAIKLSPAAGYRNFHSSWNEVVGWETGNNATRWYLTAVEPNATIADLTNLEVYITKTEALLGEVLGTVTYTRGANIDLQTTTEGSAGYIWSNAPHSEGPIANLVDGVTTNYFHTDWQSGSNVTSGDHYIAVDLGEGTTLPRFAFSHTTRSGVQNDFPKSVDVYGSDDNVTYKYLGSALDMPQSAGTFWQFDGMIISSHRYLRFNVHANRGYWHMAEFDIMPVTSYTATVNDTYSSTVTVETVQSAMEAVYNGKGVTLSMLPTEDNINERLQALRSAYEALYTEYSAAITARKNTLAQLAAQTQEIIEIAGTVGLGSNVTKLTLTTENLYCNAPYMQAGSDYSAEYVTKLTDGSATTFLHTDYSGSVAAPHYLRVYLGENSAVKSFKFNYTTRNNGNDCPTTILIEGSNEADGTYNEIRTLTTADGLPNPDYGGVAESFESLVITMGAAYKYVRFMVTGVEGGNARFFVMSEFGFSTVEDVIAVNSKYKSVVTEELLLASVHTTNSSAAMSTNELVTSVPMLDAQIADQQAAYDKLNEAMQQATCDKTELQAAYDEALALYNKMADAEGNVTANYAPSTLTVEQLAAAKTALDAAKDKLDNSNDQDEIDAAKTAVGEQYAVLLAIEEANINREGSTFDKSELGTLINDANTLLSTINGKTENNNDYYAAAGIAIDELQDAYNAAVAANGRYYLTQEQYAAVKEALNNSYTKINPIVEADVKDRTELAALATTTEELVTEVAIFNTDEKVLGMQCTDETAPYYLYCNADGTTHTTYPNDAKGVAALLDDDATNHLHTTYEGAANDNLDHYLRLDMGENEAMISFKFSYTGRSGNNNNAPKTMVIEGSNNLNDFEEIATLTDLPTTDATVTYTTPEALGNGKAYRYIRFMVTETRNNDKHEGHPFFVLSQFAVTACKTIEVSEDYVSPNLPLNTLVVANNETVDANALVEEPTTYVSQSTYTNAITELQAAYDALNTAKMLKDLPVTLTTDVNNPVLYKIKVKSNSNVFKYDGEADSGTKNLVLAANETGDKYQAWYFMQGDNENSYDDIVIMPYYHQGAKNTEYKLGYPNIDGATKPLASVSGASSYNWYITFTSTGNNVTTEGWWNLQPENGTSDNTFLNQQGGSSSTTLSFWKSAANPNDNGSQFQFVLDETDYSKSDAYYELYNLHADCGGEKVSGEAIGCYTAGTVETYNNVYNAATEKLADADATDDDYNSARTALEDAYNALERNMPVEGGFYKIRSAYKNAEGTEQYSYGGVVYVDDVNAMMWGDYDETSSRVIWNFTPVDGGYYISSLHTGAYAPSLGSGSQGVAADEAKKYTIEVLDDVTGVLKIKSPGQPMHAQESGNKLVGWNDGLNSASAWYIEEVDVKTEIGQSITLNTAEGEDKSYSTFYSAYPVTLPDGVEASVVTARADNGQLSMTVITDEYNRVVPAYTAVVLSENKQDASDSSSSGWEVKFSDDVSPAEVAEDGNMLSGTLTTEYIDCTAPSTFVYSLGRKNNRVAMYKAYKNYEKVTADNGTVTYNKVGSSSNDGGYVKLGANKSYLKVEGQNNAAVAMFSFFFGGGTTDIDGINAVAEAYEAVYDLQGRKLEKVTEPGIYIVNGKKVYVSEVE